MNLTADVIKSLSGNTAVVTGGTGMIGREIVNILCEAGAKVRSVSLDKLKIHPAADYVYGDLIDYNFCWEITRDADYVFHIAGIKGSIDVTIKKPASFFVPLLMMNTNMLEACRINKVQKGVYTSSVGAYSSTEVFKESVNLENVANLGALLPSMLSTTAWSRLATRYAPSRRACVLSLTSCCIFLVVSWILIAFMAPPLFNDGATITMSLYLCNVI
ncbi:MAG TPA: NAD-dependent epimerase/dehydratase family protein [Candidatus Wunengus sp. YC61]|uniref:NAD-dependent epimerase/dehydratase family protein n=1 Tax=Candidatus Wunengus sp. YC61 TaxID=3367698 RepID=UPI00402A0726